LKRGDASMKVCIHGSPNVIVKKRKGKGNGKVGGESQAGTDAEGKEEPTLNPRHSVLNGLNAAKLTSNSGR